MLSIFRYAMLLPQMLFLDVFDYVTRRCYYAMLLLHSDMPFRPLFAAACRHCFAASLRCCAICRHDVAYVTLIFDYFAPYAGCCHYLRLLICFRLSLLLLCRLRQRAISPLMISMMMMPRIIYAAFITLTI